MTDLTLGLAQVRTADPTGPVIAQGPRCGPIRLIPAHGTAQGPEGVEAAWVLGGGGGGLVCLVVIAAATGQDGLGVGDGQLDLGTPQGALVPTIRSGAEKGARRSRKSSTSSRGEPLKNWAGGTSIHRRSA